jgi:hypothetical protein
MNKTPTFKYYYIGREGAGEKYGDSIKTIMLVWIPMQDMKNLSLEGYINEG